MELRDKIVPLEHPLLIGPALPASTLVKKEKLRVGYSPFRELAFQIRGDWEPCDERGVPLREDPGRPYAVVHYLKLPAETPLSMDGIYGQHTQAAVALFQHLRHLRVTGDVDAVTLDKLEPLIPTNPILAFTMSRIRNVFRYSEDYAYLVKTFTSLAVTVLILGAAAVVFHLSRTLAKSTHFLARWLFTPESAPWFTALRQNNVFLTAAQWAPAVFIYIAGRAIFPAPDETSNSFPYLHTFQHWQVFVTRLGLAYVSLVFMLVGFATANAVDTIANPDQNTSNPIGSIIRASKRVIGFFGKLADHRLASWEEPVPYSRWAGRLHGSLHAGVQRLPPWSGVQRADHQQQGCADR